MLRTPVLLLCTAGAGVLLQGCGNGGDKPSPPKSKTKTTVILMRHCVRSTDDPGFINAKEGFSAYNNYSEHKFPTFPVPGMHCLPRGEQIVQAQGRYLRSQGGLPLPLRAIADNITNGQRDNVTMHNLLAGLAVDPSQLTAYIDGAPFASANTPECRKARVSDEDSIKAQTDFIKAHPAPPEYHKQLKKLVEVLGNSEAGNWTGVECKGTLSPSSWGMPQGAMPVGSCEAAAEITERMLMNYGGGIDIAWGKVKPSEFPEMLVLHSWDFFNWFACPANSAWQGSTLLRDVSDRLKTPEEGTTLYVGHDNDIMLAAGVLGLRYKATPFPDMATLPGSMLRFDLDPETDTVSASYNYVEDFSNDDTFGKMRSSPALFAGKDKISIEHFEKLVKQGTIEECSTSYRPPQKLSEDDTVVV